MSVLASIVQRQRWQTVQLLKSQRILRLAMVLAVVLLVADVAVLYRAFRGNPYPYWLNNVDFMLYYNASKAALAGDNIYAYAPCPCNIVFGSTEVHDQYVYPPFFAFLTAPLTFVGEVAGRYIWLVFTLACLGASFVVLLRGFGTRVPWPLIMIACALVPLSRTGRTDIYHGQVNFVLMFLVTFGLWLFTQGRKVPSGVMLGITFVIKPFLGLVVLLFLWRREWRTAIASVATSAMLCALSFVPLVLKQGPVAIGHWLATSGYYSSGDAATRPDNQSLNGLLLRLFQPNHFTEVWFDAPLLLTLLRVSVAVLMLAVFFATVSRHARPSSPAMILVESGLLMGLGLAYGPMFERAHLFVLVPALMGVLLVAYQRVRDHAPSARQWWWVSCGWLFVFAFVGSPVGLNPGLPPADAWMPINGLAILWTSLVALMVLGVCVGLGLVLRRERSMAL